MGAMGRKPSAGEQGERQDAKGPRATRTTKETARRRPPLPWRPPLWPAAADASGRGTKNKKRTDLFPVLAVVVRHRAAQDLVLLLREGWCVSFGEGGREGWFVRHVRSANTTLPAGE